MLTKVGYPSCLKTTPRVSKGMLSIKDKSSKNYLMKKFVKELAPSPKQLLNGQGVRKISGLQKFKV